MLIFHCPSLQQDCNSLCSAKKCFGGIRCVISLLDTWTFATRTEIVSYQQGLLMWQVLLQQSRSNTAHVQESRSHTFAIILENYGVWEDHLWFFQNAARQGSVKWPDRQCRQSLLLAMGNGFVGVQQKQLTVVIPVTCSFIFFMFSLFPALSNRIIERIFSGAVVRWGKAYWLGIEVKGTFCQAD